MGSWIKSISLKNSNCMQTILCSFLGGEFVFLFILTKKCGLKKWIQGSKDIVWSYQGGSIKSWHSQLEISDLVRILFNIGYFQWTVDGN